MPQGLLILTDIHGCWKTLQVLLSRYPDRKPVVLGDLIDRGPRSKEVVQWAMKNRIDVVLGNHEDLCLDACLSTRIYDPADWLDNGGLETIKSFGGAIPNEVLGWFQTLPLHRIYPEYPDLLLSHTGHGLILPEDKSSPSAFYRALWGRTDDFPNDGYFRVFGHCRKLEPVVKENYAMIDTGCAYTKYGTLTAFLWPERELVSHPFIDYT